jgi:hypothetical protein
MPSASAMQQLASRRRSEPPRAGPGHSIPNDPRLVASLAVVDDWQVGLGRIVALYCRSSASHQICYDIRCLHC